LELLAFDKYCHFDNSAFFWEIKRASLYFFGLSVVGYVGKELPVSHLAGI
jgi:hypothetical protein